MSVHTAALRRLAAIFDTPVMQNVMRSMYVEAQIAELLGPDWVLAGDWSGWDLTGPGGCRVEVKQASATQTWAQTRPSRGSFDIAERTGYYIGNDWVDEPGRAADIYVFAWHGRWQDDVDHRDEHQWEYVVVPTSALPASQKQLGLVRARSLGASATSENLRQVVEDTWERITSMRAVAGIAVGAYRPTPQMLAAIARLSLERVQALSGLAVAGTHPDGLTPDEELSWQASRMAVEAFPGVAWSPLGES